MIVAVLPGDSGGSEVTAQAARVLEATAKRFGHELQIETGLYGALAIDACGDPLPPESLNLAQRADALLLGGGASGPRWQDPRLRVHPAQALLKLRQELNLYANLRPVRIYPEILDLSTLKSGVVQGVDLLLVREVASGVYFGRPRKLWQTRRGRKAVDTTAYTEQEIKRVIRLAFELARNRRNHLTSVDKANVLATSKLWREIANELAVEYSDVHLEHMLVDNCAVGLLTEPRRFDVIVAENLFGYILQDVAGALTGSHGLLPGGTLGQLRKATGRPIGLYEPTRGTTPPSRPDVANPIGAILSAAMLLRHSLGLDAEARVIEEAVAAALRSGHRTADMALGESLVTSTARWGTPSFSKWTATIIHSPRVSLDFRYQIHQVNIWIRFFGLLVPCRPLGRATAVLLARRLYTSFYIRSKQSRVQRNQSRSGSRSRSFDHSSTMARVW